MSKRVILLHCHIFKNGGTTIDSILSKNFGGGAFFRERSDDQFLKSEEIIGLAAANEQLISLSSHKLALPAPEHEDFLFVPLVVLREPLDRLGSIYAFYRRLGQAISHECLLAQRYSFQSFVSLLLDSGLDSSFANLQAQFFLGNYKLSPSPSEITWPMIAANAHRVRCVGTLEAFDESLCRWQEYLADFFPNLDLAYVRQNVSVDRAARLEERLYGIEAELGPELVVRFRERNLFDYRLYRLIQGRLQNEGAREDVCHAASETRGDESCFASTMVAGDSPAWSGATIEILSCQLRDSESGRGLVVVTPGQEVEVVIMVRAVASISHPIVGFAVENSRQELVFCMNSLQNPEPLTAPRVGEMEALTFSFRFPPLSSGSYTISPAIASGSQSLHTTLCLVKDAVLFLVPVRESERLPGFIDLADYSFRQG